MKFHPQRDRTDCGAAGNSSLAIDDKLDVYPCIYGFDNEEYKLGNLTDAGLETLWLSEKSDVFRGKTKLSDLTKCKNCRFSRQCATKNCRLKPVYEGSDFYSPVSYCAVNQNLYK